MADEIIVTVDEGKIRGKVQKDYHGGKFFTFSGIPYAKAPVGELRFRAPQPIEPWDGIMDGTKEKDPCPSLDLFYNNYVGNEETCLNLNIYTKELPKNTSVNKPVMVFIHGGGFLMGSNRQAHNGPDYLMTADIVFVTINYRLGVFGFLSSNDQSLKIPGNAGLKDQAMALKWIQKNIHHFGGDAKNVTVFGESAGSASVHYLILSSTTKGLFQKAIMQSGCALNAWARGKPNVLDIGKRMGYTETDEKIIFDKLCLASAKSIVNGQPKLIDSISADEIRPYGPVIEYPNEDAFLTEDPEVIIKSGRSHQIPIIMGYNSLEGIFYEIFRKNGSKLRKTLEKDIPFNMNIPQEKSEQVGQKIKEFYYRDEDISEDNIQHKYKLVSDNQFIYGIQKSALLHKLHGSAPVYIYRMSIDTSLNMMKKLCLAKYFITMMFISFLSRLVRNFSLGSILQNLSNKLPLKEIDGVAHGDDLGYLFTTYFSPIVTKGSEEDKYIQKFVKIWTNFARTGNPTPEVDEALDKCVWVPLQGDGVDKICDIDKTITIGENLEKDRMTFWDNLLKEYAEPVRGL